MTSSSNQIEVVMMAAATVQNRKRVGLPQMQPTNGETALLERRQRVASLYCQGKSQLEIAREVKVAQTTVAGDLAKIRDAWLAHAVVDFGEARSQELAKIDHLERVAWEAWGRSCEDAVVRRRRVEMAPASVQVPGDDGRPTSRRISVMRTSREGEDTETRGRDGDDRFLARVAWCVEMRLKLLGLLDTKVVNNTQVNVGVNWDEISQGRTLPDPVEAAIEDVRRGITGGGQDLPAGEQVEVSDASAESIREDQARDAQGQPKITSRVEVLEEGGQGRQGSSDAG